MHSEILNISRKKIDKNLFQGLTDILDLQKTTLKRLSISLSR
jgi:hypothetical protein